MDMLKFYFFVIQSSSGLITFNCWKKQVKLSDFQEHLQINFFSLSVQLLNCLWTLMMTKAENEETATRVEKKKATG